MTDGYRAGFKAIVEASIAAAQNRASEKYRLEACPFCGGQPEDPEIEQVEYNSYVASICCNHCDTTFAPQYMDSSEDEAIRKAVDAWNRRAILAAHSADARKGEGVAQGFVMAPLEATDEMLEATRGPGMSPGSWNNYSKRRHAQLYRQMIGAIAAPAPKQTPSPDYIQGWQDCLSVHLNPAPAAQADYEGLRHKFDEAQRNRSPFQAEVERMTRQQSATPAVPEHVCKCTMTQKLVGDGCVACNPDHPDANPADAASEADKRDAERYRWLRACRPEDLPQYSVSRELYEGDELDAFVDAALQRERQQGADRGE